MSLLTRLFRLGQAEANAAIDKMEDPVRMTEQGIRELRNQLTEAMKGLGTVKAQAIRARRDTDQAAEVAADYERKAMMLVQRGQTGQMDAAEADRLAGEALMRSDEAAKRAATHGAEARRYDEMAAKLEQQIARLKSEIDRYENELRTLKARSQVSKATRKLNEQLARVDSSGTIAMLERMRDKVQEEEALAEAYGEIAAVPKSVDAEIDAALARVDTSASDRLAQLKARMGAPKALPSS